MPIVSASQQCAEPLILKVLPALTLILAFGAQVIAQVNEPVTVFRPALEQILSQTQLPILLPSSLPSPLRAIDIKLASGTASNDGYFISLYFDEVGSDATFAAGFGASKRTFKELPNTHRVALAGGALGMFRPVSCGGSCGPANLWWEQNGVMYQIQIKLSSTLAEKDQENILVETANSCVTIRRK
jgi:hypothetical protein